MSDSAMPGPSATRRRCAGLLRFLLLMTIYSVSSHAPPLGPPGEPANHANPGPPFMRCPSSECNEYAERQLDGSYECKHHICRIENGSFACVNKHGFSAAGEPSAS
jgi:hypothetical protein